jgi:cell division protein FtsW (lipid II flippase)
MRYASYQYSVIIVLVCADVKHHRCSSIAYIGTICSLLVVAVVKVIVTHSNCSRCWI